MLKYPDHVLESPVINKRLAMEARFDSQRGDGAKGHYWMLTRVPSTGQVVVCANFKPSENPLSLLTADYNMPPHQAQQEYAAAFLAELNKQLHHDGGWIVGYTHPPAAHVLLKTDADNVWGRLVCIWLDADGDPQFTYECDRPFMEVFQEGIHDRMEMAAKSWAQWRMQQRDDMDLKSTQTFKAAQGEVAPSDKG